MSTLLQVLADDNNNVSYRPKLNKITGSVTATILLQQILYWYSKQGEFYKFKQQCTHPSYKEGDSWCEELGFTVYEFDSALKKLKELKIVETRKTMDRKTFFSLDTTLLGNLIKSIYVNGKNPVSIYSKDYYRERETPPHEKGEGEEILNKMEKDIQDIQANPLFPVLQKKYASKNKELDILDELKICLSNYYNTNNKRNQVDYFSNWVDNLKKEWKKEEEIDEDGNLVLIPADENRPTIQELVKKLK